MVSSEYFMIPKVSVLVLTISLTIKPITNPAMIVGFQTLRNSASRSMEIMADSMSNSQGP